MKQMLPVLFASLGVLLVPIFSAQAAFINQPNITSVERTDVKPIPTLVEWELSRNATDGVVVNDHVTVELREDSTVGPSIGSIDIAGDATSVLVTKALFPLIRSHGKYGVIVTEVRTDDDEVSDSDRLYTGPPKLKRLRIKDTTEDIDGTISTTLRWKKPASLNGESVRYVYRVRRNGTTTTLIKEGAETGDMNSIRLTGLPYAKMKVQVRVEDSVLTYGVGQWSAWKKFRSPEK